MKARLVQVFRSARHEDMFLIVDRARGLAELPEALLTRFGTAEPSIVFMLRPDRAMALADAPRVLAAIDEHGFYLQLPPAEGDAVSVVLAAAEEHDRDDA